MLTITVETNHVDFISVPNFLALTQLKTSNHQKTSKISKIK